MFKGFFTAAAVLFLLFLIENFLNCFLVGNGPPLVLIGVVYYSLKKGPMVGMWLGFFAGFWTEIFGQGFLGSSILPMGLAGMLIGFVSTQLFQDGWLSAFLMPSLAAYCYLLAELFYVRIPLRQLSPDIFLLAFQGRVLLWALFLSPCLFVLLERTHGKRPS